MITVEFITALFSEVDEQMGAIPRHPEAHLWPSAVVTLGLLHALKGVGNRAFNRWLTRDDRAFFPRLPERTRLFRLFNLLDRALVSHVLPDHGLPPRIVADGKAPHVGVWARCCWHLGSRRGRADQGRGRTLPGTGASNAFSIIATIV